MVARLLITLYTNQIIRIKWGNTYSFRFSVLNGVKQGGVMSPILFTLYIYILLERLCKSYRGCYIGKRFCGALDMPMT